MHYYQFNIGDYARDTQHLDHIEDIIYRRIIDYYYLNESPIPDDIKDISRLIRMRTECERIADVLREFFTLNDGVWIHKRIDEDIRKYREKSAKAKMSAKARWDKEPCERIANAKQSQCEGNANQEPRTKNQEPPIKKNTQKKSDENLDYSSWPEIPDPQILKDWLSMRKRKKADVSQTVLNSFGKQLHKAKDIGLSVDECLSECITRSWTGFKVEWITKQQSGNTNKNTKSFSEMNYGDTVEDL